MSFHHYRECYQPRRALYLPLWALWLWRWL